MPRSSPESPSVICPPANPACCWPASNQHRLRAPMYFANSTPLLMKRFLVFFFIAVALVAPLDAQRRASQPNFADLRELDVTNWDCPPEGDAVGDGDQVRNDMKNRKRFMHAARAS